MGPNPVFRAPALHVRLGSDHGQTMRRSETTRCADKRPRLIDDAVAWVGRFSLLTWGYAQQRPRTS